MKKSHIDFIENHVRSKLTGKNIAVELAKHRMCYRDRIHTCCERMVEAGAFCDNVDEAKEVIKSMDLESWNRWIWKLSPMDLWELYKTLVAYAVMRMMNECE